MYDHRRPVCRPAHALFQHGVQIGHHLPRAGHVGLVDHVDIGGFENAAFHRLDLVAGAGGEHQHQRVDQAADGVFHLADADGLDHHFGEAEAVDCGEDVVQIVGQAVRAAAAGEGADVDMRVGGEVLHADAVAEDGAAADRAGGVDGDDCEVVVFAQSVRRQFGEQAAFAGAGGSGDADTTTAVALGGGGGQGFCDGRVGEAAEKAG